MIKCKLGIFTDCFVRSLVGIINARWPVKSSAFVTEVLQCELRRALLCPWGKSNELRNSWIYICSFLAQLSQSTAAVIAIGTWWKNVTRAFFRWFLFFFLTNFDNFFGQLFYDFFSRETFFGLFFLFSKKWNCQLIPQQNIVILHIKSG